MPADPICAGDAQPEGVFRHLSQRAFDVLDGLTCGCRQCEVTFAFDVDGVALTGFLVELCVALLAFAGEEVRFGGEFVGLAEVTCPFGFEPFP